MIQLKKGFVLALTMLLCMVCFAALAQDIAYIDTLSITKVITGTAPFDGNNDPGNDQNDSNNVVRTFDTVNYSLDLNIEPYQTSEEAGSQYKEARLCYAVRIPFTSDEAEFNVDSMAWMEKGFHVEEDEKGQTLYCSLLKKSDGGYAVPGTQSVFISLNIKNVKNGTIVRPDFYAWVEGNQVHTADWKASDGELYKVDWNKAEQACTQHDHAELKKVTGDEIKVSAKMKLNVKLTQFAHSYGAKYNFNVGNDANKPIPAMNKGLGIIKGTGASLSISVMLQNDTAEKGMRGIEYPDGSPITFDIQLDSYFQVEATEQKLPVTGTHNGIAYDYAPLLYSYGGATYDYTNADGRSVPQRTGIPNNVRKAGQDEYTCYNGGNWNVTQNGNVFTVTLSGYEINGIFPHTSSANGTPNQYKPHMGYFSTGEMHFIAPHNNRAGTGGEYIAELLGSGSFVLNLTEGNLQANAASGPLASATPGALPANNNQMVKNDDTKSVNALLTRPGSYSSVAAYETPGGLDQYKPFTPGCFYDSRDWAFPGARIGILAGMWSCNPNGFDENRVVAYDDFLRFDAEAVVLADEYKSTANADHPGYMASFGKPNGTDDIVDNRLGGDMASSGQRVSFLYAVKKDGTNWTSDDEMRSTTQESDNLLWFDTLSEANAKGKIVGLLFQFRGRTRVDVSYPRYHVLAYIRSDTPTHDTYMICHETRVWNQMSLEKLGDVIPDEMTDAQMIEWCREKIPMRTESDAGYGADAQTLQKYRDACVSVFNTPYQRLIYHEDGSVTGGNGEYRYGDSIYVSDYNTKISIDVLNSASVNAGNNHVFDMGAGQNVADFSLTPSFVLPDAVTDESSECHVIDVTVTQTLPAGLSYRNGSSYWGGQYQAAASHGKQGSVVPDENNFALKLSETSPVSYTHSFAGKDYTVTVTMDVSRNAKGETTIVYHFAGVPVYKRDSGETALDHLIFFSTDIEQSNSQSWTLEESVTIQGSDEHSKISAEYGNQATTSILAYQNTAQGLGVTADNLYNEQNADLGWLITYQNDTSSPRENALMFTQMPAGRHHGTYEWSEWTLDLAALGGDGSGLQLWYTTQTVTDDTFPGLTVDNLAEKGFAAISGLTASGGKLTADIPDAAKHATAWVVTGTVGAQKALKVHMGVTPTGNVAADAYRTSTYMPAVGQPLMSYATVYIVSRELSGLVWYDQDADGVREEGEPAIGSLPLTLSRKEGSSYTAVTTDVTGAALPATSNADGTYLFSKLPQGEYVVRFIRPDGYTGLTVWHASAADDSTNSDGKVSGSVYVSDPGIVFSSAQDIGFAYTQKAEHVDIGLVKTAPLTVEKTVSGDVPAADAGRKFSFQLKLTVNGQPYTNNVAWAIGTQDQTALTPSQQGVVTFELQAGQKATFKNLPQLAQYTVSEISAPNGYTPQWTGDEGSISTGAQAVCHNRYQPEATTYAPQVKKQLTGPQPPVNAAFTFTLAQSDTNPVGATLPEDTELTINGAGTGSFDAISFSRAGQYTFTITEKPTNSDLYTDDPTGAWTLNVTVTDNAGALQVTSAAYTRGTESSAAEAIFTNHYQPKAVTWAPQVTKALEGAVPPAAADFVFELAYTGASTEALTLPADTSLTINGTGAGSFGDITFTLPGEYTFTITETSTADHGYTNDTKGAWTLKVVVKDMNGQLTVDSAAYARGTETGSTAVFTNHYQPDTTTYAPKVTKQLTGVTPPSAAAFTFTLAQSSSNPAGATLPEDAQLTITGANVGSFGNISFSRAGEYNFTITETSTADHGYTNDPNNMWSVRVTVIDEDGRLHVESAAYMRTVDNGGTQNGDAAVFTNHYQPDSAACAPQVKKQLAGPKPPVDAAFTFTLAQSDTNPVGATLPETKSLTINGAGTDSFGNISFSRAGEYNFTIIETSAADHGYTNDTKGAWTLKVIVEDAAGKLRVKSTQYTRGEESSATEATFTNHYQPDTTTYVPQVTKQLTGVTPPTAAAFTFTLAQSSSNPGAALPEDAQLTITGAGTDSFGNISFSRAGEYTFTITETATADHGYTNDPNSTWVLKVIVEDAAGKLRVKSTQYTRGEESSATEATFTNHYQPDETAYAAQVTKQLTGVTPPTTAAFTFTLAQSSSNPAGATLPATTSLTINGAGTGSFGNISFSRAGEYTFTITEAATNIHGYTNDPNNMWSLKVTVIDEDGRLHVESAAYMRTVNNGGTQNGDAAVFTNHYQPDSAACAPQVKKQLNGPKPPVDAAFTFALAQSDSNPVGAVLPEDAQLTITGAGTGSFGDITFERAGQYTFTITEMPTGSDLYTDDPTGMWTLSVDVADESGELKVKSTQYTRGSENGSIAVFTNHYHPKAAVYAPQVKKQLTGPKPPVDAAFTFTLAQSSSNPVGATLPATTSLTINGADTARFGDITFTLPGEYTFTITENATDSNVYTDDPANVWTLKVVVTDNAGQLEKTVRYTRGEESSETEAAFTNHYHPKAVTYAPKVVKLLSGPTPPQNATFAFVLARDGETAEGAALPQTTRLTIDGTGTASFDAVTFTLPGEYAFTITEEAVTAPGYTIDPNGAWKLSVVIEDNNGELTVKSTRYTRGDDSADDEAVFTNLYSTTPTDYTVQVGKRILGTPAQEETFTFTLSGDGASMVLPQNVTAQVTGEGTATFDKVRFTAAGQYTLAVTEAKGQTANCIYDSRVLTFVITVTDLGGELKVTGAVCEQNGEACEAEFVNRYLAGSLRIEKRVEGTYAETERTWNFTVTLTDAQGNPLAGSYPYSGAQTGRITSGGSLQLKHGESIVIDALPQGTLYTVTEKEANQLSYSTQVTGGMGVIVDGMQSQALFVNSRDLPTVPPTGDHEQPLLYALLCLMALACIIKLKKKA